MSDKPTLAEPWMLGYVCDLCDLEIERGQSVIVVDIDWSDRAERAVATVRHDVCPHDASAGMLVGDTDVRENR